jgi:uncharacterized protein (DUF1697 family)
MIAGMTTYIAFLRGINVGGNSLIKMIALKEALVAAGLSEVRTYIASGNVIFESNEKDKAILAALIKKTIFDTFSMTVDIVVFTKKEWRDIVEAAPDWWGVDKTWKHNILIMIKPSTMEEVMSAFDGLKEDIESVQAGKGVVYQSVCFAKFGSAKSGKLAANPVYKKMTIRNYNTATKLAMLLE